MPIERELKFRFPESRTQAELWRALDGKPDRRRLEATYLDTGDGTLRGARTALRLRRSGRRWLQCFKTDAAAGGVLLGRNEWELTARGGRLRIAAFPLSEIRASSGIDLAALEPELRPVFKATFERGTVEIDVSGSRVEVAFDRGTISAGRRIAPLREVEFELLAGEMLPVLGRVRELIPALALELEVHSKAERGYRLAVGEHARPVKATRPPVDPGTTAQGAVGAVIGACVSQVAANVRGAALARDPEYLHQLRVGLRRLRSALRVLRAHASAERTRTLVDGLRALLPPLGVARDWDVMADLLERRIAPAAGGAIDFAPALRWVRRRRTRARRDARTVAASSGFQQLLIDALIWAEHAGRANDHANAAAAPAHTPPAQQTLAAFAKRKVVRLARKVEQSGDGCAWSEGDARHQVRIRLKRLRYVCEFFFTCFKRKRVRRYLAHLEALQDLLGELNDIRTARQLLAPPGGMGEVQIAFVNGWLSAREAALIGALDDAWRAFRDQRRPA